MDFSEHKKPTIKKILKLCERNTKSLSELSEALEMNKHTLRSKYLYPMVTAGLLERTHEPPFKSGNRYKAKQTTL